MLECLNVCGKVRSRQKSAPSSAGRSDEVLCGIPCWNFILLLVGVCTSAGWVGSERRLRGHCWKNILRPLRPRVNPASPCSSLNCITKTQMGISSAHWRGGQWVTGQGWSEKEAFLGKTLLIIVSSERDSWSGRTASASGRIKAANTKVWGWFSGFRLGLPL